jgi:hypothetical protein
MPYRRERRNRLERVSWSHLWVSVNDPSDVYTETLVSGTGSPTKTGNNDGTTSITTPATAIYRYEKTAAVSLLPSSVALGVSAQVTAGTAYYDLRCSIDTQDALVTIKHDTTALEVWNGGLSGTKVADVAVTDHVQIVANIVAGDFVVYYRTAGDADARAWTRLAGTTATKVTAVVNRQQASMQLQSSTTVRVAYLGVNLYESVNAQPHTALG